MCRPGTVLENTWQQPFMFPYWRRQRQARCILSPFETSGMTKEFFVSSYFFVNAGNATDSLLVSVNKISCTAGDTLRFKYFINEWGNDDLLLFKLDSRPQLTELTYKLEYVMQAANNQTKRVQATWNLVASRFRASIFLRTAYWRCIPSKQRPATRLRRETVGKGSQSEQETECAITIIILHVMRRYYIY